METSHSPSFTASSIEKANTRFPTKDDRNILIFDFLGYTVFVGRNALSNENLIQTHSHMECVWLHASGGKGAHVILCTNGCNDNPDLYVKALKYAGSLALRFSKASSKKVAYAILADVFKPQNGGPGIFRTWKTQYLEMGK